MILLVGIVGFSGCVRPLDPDDTDDIRQYLIESHRQQVRSISEASTQKTKISPDDFYLNKEDPDRIKELDESSGLEAFEKAALNAGPGLDGRPSEAVTLTLRQAIQATVNNNLDVKLATIQPGISEAQVVAAEAAFDGTFFTDATLTKTNQPQQAIAGVGGLPQSAASRSVEDLALRTGIRKQLITGGQASVSTGLDYTNSSTGTVVLVPDPAWTSDIQLSLTQPLMRNFGKEVNRAQIMLRRNTQRRDVLTLHARLLQTVADAEAAYWDLVFARRQLAIHEKLLVDTLATRKKIDDRKEFDVSPVQRAQAYSFVELRRQDVVRDRQTLRTLSDRLKRLLNNPNLSLADETLIVPADRPVEMAVDYNLLDAVTTAMQKRPEVLAALLNIDDASIRQMAADNQRLPLLNLNAQVQYFGFGSEHSNSFSNLRDADFIDYLIGLQFEQPIGNRAAEATMKQTRLARQASVVQYKNTVQEVALSVKEAMRQLVTSFELIGIARATRRAAAENLRVIEEREKQGEAQTADFLLDLKLNTQQRVSEAAIAEIRSVIDYNIAYARLLQSNGTLLEHNQIQFEWPQDMFAP
ncbi:MAG: TolC family protein [Phycisphaerae bacterium]|nr:TolC family protein [Phycisphaerae bacterium]